MLSAVKGVLSLKNESSDDGGFELNYAFVIIFA